MQIKSIIEVNNVSVMSSINTRNKLNTHSENQDKVFYLRDINLKFQSGDVVLLVDPQGDSKFTLTKICAGQIIPTSGSVTTTGDVFPGLTPDFGLVPKATLHQNIILRGHRLGYNRSEINDYYDKVFDDKDLLNIKNSTYLEIGADLQTLFLLQSLEPLNIDIIFLEKWLRSSSEILQSRSIALLKKIILEAEIVILAIEKPKLIFNLRNKEVIFNNKSIQSVISAPFV